MTEGSVRSRHFTLAAGGAALFVGGALVSHLVLGRAAPPMEPEGATSTHVPQSAAGGATGLPHEPTGPLPDVTVPVPADAGERIGIQVAAARAGGVARRLRLPGTVEPNQYQQVIVTPLVSGRVTSVDVQLGDRVRRGAALARIYSSDLSEAQTKYVSLRAELGAADARLKRTTRLVEIGAASRQELEAEEAQRTRLATEMQGAASRLRELGLSPQRVSAMSSPSQVSASVVVPSPTTGVVTERKANTGLVVDPSTALFTIAALSPVWVIADVQEADLARVRIGNDATVTSDAFPGLVLSGKVAYIAPDLRAETRTAQVRVEVPNRDGQLRFGMFVHVDVAVPASSSGASVPAEAVQTIGARHFVYIAPPGRSGEYIEREVTVGARDDEAVEIVRGINAGDVVVTTGSFLVRAERERLGLRAPAPVSPAPQAATSPGPVKITVGDGGFEPARVEVSKGTRITLEFTRVSEKTCATEVAVPDQQIKRALPLNTPVTVDVSVETVGEIVFTCGMNMLKGAVVVR